MAALTEILQNPYVTALAIFLGFFIGAKIVHFVIERVISRLAAKTTTKLDDLLIDRTKGPMTLLILLYGLFLGLQPLPIHERYFEIIISALHSALILLLFFISIRILDALIDVWGQRIAARTKNVVDDELFKIFHRFSRIFISIIAFLTVLAYWGVDIGPLLTGLGIGGIAIAFALQNSLGNIFGGISLIIDKSVKVGDVIEIDETTSGKIIDVGLRSTKIRTWDNEVVIIPNGKLADSKIKNMILPDPSIRAIVKFGVEYGSDPEKVKKVVLGVVKKIPTVLADPAPSVEFLEMGDFSLNFRATMWVKDYNERWHTKLKATEDIYLALNRAKIGIPFPTRTIYMKK